METVNTQTGEPNRSIKAIAKKITLAMADMDAHAPKDGTNTFHKYEYTSIAQYMAHVRPALIKHGLVIIPNLISRTDYDDATTDVLMEYTIIDSDSGEYLRVRMEGRGQDASSTGRRLDKGPYKAYSGAFKYFLAETFMIASGDDPDDGAPKQILKIKSATQHKPVVIDATTGEVIDSQPKKENGKVRHFNTPRDGYLFKINELLTALRGRGDEPELEPKFLDTATDSELIEFGKELKLRLANLQAGRTEQSVLIEAEVPATPGAAYEETN